MKKAIALIISLLLFSIAGCSKPAPSVEFPSPDQGSKDDNIHACTEGEVSTEEEFLKTIKETKSSNPNLNFSDWEYYYRPANIPEGYELKTIKFSYSGCNFIYSNAQGGHYEFAWNKTMLDEAVFNYYSIGGSILVEIDGLEGDDILITSTSLLEFGEAISKAKSDGNDDIIAWPLFYRIGGEVFMADIPFDTPECDIHLYMMPEKVMVSDSN